MAVKGCCCIQTQSETAWLYGKTHERTATRLTGLLSGVDGGLLGRLLGWLLTGLLRRLLRRFLGCVEELETLRAGNRSA